jgi:hypothetical protein
MIRHINFGRRWHAAALAFGLLALLTLTNTIASAQGPAVWVLATGSPTINPDGVQPHMTGTQDAGYSWATDTSFSATGAFIHHQWFDGKHAVVKDVTISVTLQGVPQQVQSGVPYNISVVMQANMQGSSVVGGYAEGMSLGLSFSGLNCQKTGGDEETGYGGKWSGQDQLTYQCIADPSYSNLSVVLQWNTNYTNASAIVDYEYVMQSSGGTNPPINPNPPTNPQPNLQARLNCGNHVTVWPGQQPSVPCDLIIWGFRSDTATPVNVTVAGADLTGLLPDGVWVSSNSFSIDPTNMNRPEDESMLLWNACPQPGISPCPVPIAGDHVEQIFVSQGNEQVEVDLIVTVVVGPGSGGAVLTFLDRNFDEASPYSIKADGVPDGRFELDVSGGGRDITWIRLEVTDGNGNTIPSAPTWETVPNPNNPGAWMLAVFDYVSTGQLLNKDWGVNLTVPFKYQLLAADPRNGTDYFAHGQHFLVTIQFDNTPSEEIQATTVIP